MATKEYRETHRDEIREYARRYRAEHPDKIAEQRKRYKENHPEQRAAERKRYKENHPEQRAAERKRYKKNHPEIVKAEHKRYRKVHPEKEQRRESLKTIERHRFLAIDGEGWTTNGIHNYHMIVTSDPKLYLQSKRPLSTIQCLKFIGSIRVPKGTHIVSFFFDYDTTMILRDMVQEDPDQAARLFEPGRKAFVWWHGIGIKYVPHKHLSVKLTQGSPTVTVHDTQGYFQSSFVTALRKFEIGDEKTLHRIESMKLQRSEFVADDVNDIRKYSLSECRMLVQLIERVRDRSHAVGLNPYPYEGPGGLASRAMEKHYTRFTHRNVVANIPDKMKYDIPMFLYGGRFETSVNGFVSAHVREYDRHSAYPAILASMPCFEHGYWSHARKRDGQYAISHLRFHHTTEPSAGLFYGLPLRRRSGALQFPQDGGGWYWQHEYANIPDLEYDIDSRWVWVPDNCKCEPFAWVRDLFAQREAMESEHKGSGIVLKLALNTLYGKTAQTKPTIGAWANLIHASYITSRLRSDMYSLYLQCEPMTTFMFATDAIFTSSELPVSHGLGGLELADEYDDLTIVQPGLYFDTSNAHYKTRGIPKRYVEAFGDEICVAAELGVEYPMKVNQFHGMRSTLSTGHLENTGQWIDSYRIISTRQESKRAGQFRINNMNFTMPTINTNVDGESMARSDTDVVTLAMITDMMIDENDLD